MGGPWLARMDLDSWDPQITLAHILIERDTTPPPDAARYLVLAQEKEEDEEDNDEEINYWSRSNYDWHLDNEDEAPSNEEGFSWDITEAMRV